MSSLVSRVKASVDREIVPTFYQTLGRALMPTARATMGEGQKVSLDPGRRVQLIAKSPRPMMVAWHCLLGSVLLAGSLAQELGVIYMKLEGMKEKCLVEELPENTVALGIAALPSAR